MIARPDGPLQSTPVPSDGAHPGAGAGDPWHPHRTGLRSRPHLEYDGLTPSSASLPCQQPCERPHLATKPGHPGIGHAKERRLSGADMRPLPRLGPPRGQAESQTGSSCPPMQIAPDAPSRPPCRPGKDSAGRVRTVRVLGGCSCEKVIRAGGHLHSGRANGALVIGVNDDRVRHRAVKLPNMRT